MGVLFGICQVIAASGAVKHEEIVEQVKKLFTKLSSDPTTATQLVAKEPTDFTGSEVRIIDDDIPLAQFAVAFSGASWTDPDSIALMVMQAMLGSWNKSASGGKHMGSELAQKVGINEIAESTMSFNTNYKDTGLFGVYAVAKLDCLDDLAYAIMYETTKVCYRVSEADVTRARNQSSNFCKLCDKGERLNGKILELPEGSERREYIIGDLGYSLLPYLIIPYEGKELPESRAEFNRRHHATQMVAHGALARLKDVENYSRSDVEA
ncbi:probable mitochondrial-processing peptidase subunit beta, mitochondrial [Quercus lobata]|nr:probable mitochondrial-processing peptidase subunit beta, mitochondrial [Quercus lobata]